MGESLASAPIDAFDLGADANLPLSVVPDLTGEGYVEVLRRMHAVLSPRTYLEIGCHTGQSLAFARGKIIAIDPSFAVMSNVFANKTACHFFQMPSDTFFRDHDPRAIFGDVIDMAFLDGMHLYEYALRDFMNTERFCKPNSVVMLHDCVPVDVHITTRADDAEHRQRFSTKKIWWTGDVWKLVVILRRYRPDLSITVLDAPPTGLVVITNLDPNSRVLQDEYAAISAEWGDVELLDYGITRYFDEIDLHSTRDFATHVDIARRFWL